MQNDSKINSPFDLEDSKSEIAPEIKEAKSSKSKFGLTDEQKLAVLKEWNRRLSDPPSIVELIRMVFPSVPDPKANLKEGRAIKEYLATKDIEAKPTSEYNRKGLLDLSPEQKQFIDNNSKTMRPIEITRVLFKNSGLMPMSQEARTVHTYYNNLPLSSRYEAPEDVEIEGYKAPASVEGAIKRVKKYILDCKLDAEKLTGKQRKGIETLVSYLSSFRFGFQICTYEKKEDRALFESTFIKYTYDKDDLSAEDVDLFIMLCTEIVMGSHIQKTIDMLQGEQDRTLRDEDKLSMVLVEAINTARTEHNSCTKRQQSLYKDLTEGRSERLSKQIQQTSSLLNLVSAWKMKTTRDQIIKIAEQRKKLVEEEIDRLSNLDDLKTKILGISKEEILEG